MRTTKPALPRDPQVDLMRFAYVKAIDDIAAIDQSRTHDQSIAPGLRQQRRNACRRVGPQHVRVINVVRVSCRARYGIGFVEQPVVIVDNQNHRLPSHDVSSKPRPSRNGGDNLVHQDIDCVPALITVGQITQRQISIETFWTYSRNPMGMAFPLNW
jgi:hypothetical protein